MTTQNTDKGQAFAEADGQGHCALGDGSAVCAFAIPINPAEAVWALHNGMPIEIPRGYLSKLMNALDSWCEFDVEIDVKLEGLRAYLTPRRCVLTDAGRHALLPNTP
jgi:hypothetical protein